MASVIEDKLKKAVDAARKLFEAQTGRKIESAAGTAGTSLPKGGRGSAAK